MCRANDNKRWNTKRKKCVNCPSCLPGKARNLTMTYDGPTSKFGDTKCLPCMKCMHGFFAGDDGCRPCRKYCITDYNREVQEPCEDSHDASCGSCLFGYEDDYRNLDMPCIKQADLEPKEKNTTFNENDNIHNIPLSEEEISSNIRSSPSYGPHIAVIALSALIIAILIIVTVYIYTKRRVNKTQSYPDAYNGLEAGQSSNTSTSDVSIDKSQGTDSNSDIIDIDAVPTPSRSSNDVRGELQSEIDPLLGEPHRELSQRSNVNDIQRLGIEYRDNSTVAGTSSPPTNKCGCRKIEGCTCYIIDTANDKDITHNDIYIQIVLAGVCHDERPLYQKLGLPNAEIHGVEDDRLIDPKKTPLKEKVNLLLNRWVEMQCSPVKLSTLMKALCDSHFHGINYELRKKVQPADTSLEHDNAGLDS
ncbi:hypothetical protein ACF0H5_014552 [Mactra antiquata]